MKQLIFTALSGYLFIVLAGTAYTVPVSANATSDCRQESVDYDIPAEQRDDYIYDCLVSRGELITDGIADDTAGENYVSPDEQDVQQDPQTDNNDAAQ